MEKSFEETLDMRSFEQKFEDFKVTTKRKAKKALDWAVAHPEISIPVITITIPATVKIVKAVASTVKEARLEHHRLCMAWDPKRGEYLQLVRPLKSSEQVRLDELMTGGMTKTAALDLMGLLK